MTTRPRPRIQRTSKRASTDRRALSHVGGKLEVWGDARVGQVLKAALQVGGEADAAERGGAATNVDRRAQGQEDPAQADVHGFHSYAARLHPVTARTIIEGLSQPGDVVLDAFCGSGTTLVEARRLGRRALGVDLNPLGIELSWLKTLGPNSQFCEALLAAAQAVRDEAEERRRSKAGPTRRYGPEDRELFPPHVLLELDGLNDAIQRVSDPALRRALKLVLSAIMTKVSRRRGDAALGQREPRLASGYTIRLFFKKAKDLSVRLAAFSASLPKAAPEARVYSGDARELRPVRTASVTLLLSSPPYPGVYDYFEQHRARLRWLGLKHEQFSRLEMGSRRDSQRKGADALADWERDFGGFLRQARRVVAPGGKVVLVCADSAIADRALYASDYVPRLAEQAGLRLIARASQPRPHFHAQSRALFRARPRAEHVFVFASKGPVAKRAPGRARGEGNEQMTAGAKRRSAINATGDGRKAVKAFAETARRRPKGRSR